MPNESKEHTMLKVKARDWLKSEGFEWAVEENIQSFVVDMVGEKNDRKIGVECGYCKKEKLAKLIRGNGLDELYLLPYGATKPSKIHDLSSLPETEPEERDTEPKRQEKIEELKKSLRKKETDNKGLKSKEDLIRDVIVDIEFPLVLRLIKNIVESSEGAYGRTVTKVWIKEVAKEMDGIDIDQITYKGNAYNVVKKEDQSVDNLEKREKKKIVEGI